MAITLKTHKILWGRAANRCALCKTELVENATDTDDESIIGEECHIVAKKPDGPRGQSPLTSEERDKVSNLILLCNKHHKIIDGQTNGYSVEKLQEIKKLHEDWVNTNLDFDEQRQHDDEIYADYVEYWSNTMKLDEWDNWTSYIFDSGEFSLHVDMLKALEEINTWYLARIMPCRYKKLEAALCNFCHVARDLRSIFMKHPEEYSNGFLRIEKFYRMKYSKSVESYNTSLEEYKIHVKLVVDLLLELTRAANYVCDMVRFELSRNYRIHEGVVLITFICPNNPSIGKCRTEYRDKERVDLPYPGLEEFKTVRFTRDCHLFDN